MLIMTVIMIATVIAVCIIGDAEADKYGQLYEEKRRCDYLKRPDDIVLEDFIEFRFQSVVQVPIIAVYKNPKDYPDKYIARLWNINNKPTKFIIVKDTLQAIRKSLPAHLTRLPPDHRDDPVIVETWI